jgi:hypothetical protein
MHTHNCATNVKTELTLSSNTFDNGGGASAACRSTLTPKLLLLVLSLLLLALQRLRPKCSNAVDWIALLATDSSFHLNKSVGERPSNNYYTVAFSRPENNCIITEQVCCSWTTKTGEVAARANGLPQLSP